MRHGFGVALQLEVLRSARIVRIQMLLLDSDLVKIGITLWLIMNTIPRFVLNHQALCLHRVLTVKVMTLSGILVIFVASGFVRWSSGDSITSRNLAAWAVLRLLLDRIFIASD